MKWLLVCIGLYGCFNEPSADDIHAYYTQEECKAAENIYNQNRHSDKYEYRCLPMPSTTRSNDEVKK